MSVSNKNDDKKKPGKTPAGFDPLGRLKASGLYRSYLDTRAPFTLRATPATSSRLGSAQPAGSQPAEASAGVGAQPPRSVPHPATGVQGTVAAAQAGAAPANNNPALPATFVPPTRPIAPYGYAPYPSPYGYGRAYVPPYAPYAPYPPYPVPVAPSFNSPFANYSSQTRQLLDYDPLAEYTNNPATNALVASALASSQNASYYPPQPVVSTALAPYQPAHQAEAIIGFVNHATRLIGSVQQQLLAQNELLNKQQEQVIRQQELIDQLHEKLLSERVVREETKALPEEVDVEPEPEVTTEPIEVVITPTQLTKTVVAEEPAVSAAQQQIDTLKEALAALTKRLDEKEAAAQVKPVVVEAVPVAVKPPVSVVEETAEIRRDAVGEVTFSPETQPATVDVVAAAAAASEFATLVQAEQSLPPPEPAPVPVEPPKPTAEEIQQQREAEEAAILQESKLNPERRFWENLVGREKYGFYNNKTWNWLGYFDRLARWVPYAGAEAMPKLPGLHTGLIELKTKDSLFWKRLVNHPEYGHREEGVWVWDGVFDQNLNWIPDPTLEKFSPAAIAAAQAAAAVAASKPAPAPERVVHEEIVLTVDVPAKKAPLVSETISPAKADDASEVKDVTKAVEATPTAWQPQVFTPDVKQATPSVVETSPEPTPVPTAVSPSSEQKTPELKQAEDVVPPLPLAEPEPLSADADLLRLQAEIAKVAAALADEIKTDDYGILPAQDTVDADLTPSGKDEVEEIEIQPDETKQVDDTSEAELVVEPAVEPVGEVAAVIKPEPKVEPVAQPELVAEHKPIESGSVTSEFDAALSVPEVTHEEAIGITIPTVLITSDSPSEEVVVEPEEAVVTPEVVHEPALDVAAFTEELSVPEVVHEEVSGETIPTAVIAPGAISEEVEVDQLQEPAPEDTAVTEPEPTVDEITPEPELVVEPEVAAESEPVLAAEPVVEPTPEPEVAAESEPDFASDIDTSAPTEETAPVEPEAEESEQVAPEPADDAASSADEEPAFWEKYVGDTDYGYFDADDNWNWTGYFDADQNWTSTVEITEPLEPEVKVSDESGTLEVPAPAGEPTIPADLGEPDLAAGLDDTISDEPSDVVEVAPESAEAEVQAVEAEPAAAVEELGAPDFTSGIEPEAEAAAAADEAVAVEAEAPVVELAEPDFSSAEAEESAPATEPEPDFASDIDASGPTEEIAPVEVEPEPTPEETKPEPAAAGEYWEQFVGQEGYGSYDANGEWVWAGYFDADNNWVPAETQAEAAADEEIENVNVIYADAEGKIDFDQYVDNEYFGWRDENGDWQWYEGEFDDAGNWHVEQEVQASQVNIADEIPVFKDVDIESVDADEWLSQFDSSDAEKIFGDKK